MSTCKGIKDKSISPLWHQQLRSWLDFYNPTFFHSFDPASPRCTFNNCISWNLSQWGLCNPVIVWCNTRVFLLAIFVLEMKSSFGLNRKTSRKAGTLFLLVFGISFIARASLGDDTNPSYISVFLTHCSFFNVIFLILFFFYFHVSQFYLPCPPILVFSAVYR